MKRAISPRNIFPAALQWRHARPVPQDVRLPDIESRFTCQACGKRGADVRPNFHWEDEARRAVHV